MTSYKDKTLIKNRLKTSNTWKKEIPTKTNDELRLTPVPKRRRQQIFSNTPFRGTSLISVFHRTRILKEFRMVYVQSLRHKTSGEALFVFQVNRGHTVPKEITTNLLLMTTNKKKELIVVVIRLTVNGGE